MIEYRTTLGAVEGTQGGFRGVVTPFMVWTTIGDLKRGGFKERIAPGTFAKTLQERDIVFLWNHNTDMPMARSSVPEGQMGHLSLGENERTGLEADVPEPVDTDYAENLKKLANAGVVRGMSFGFEVIKDSWTDDQGRASDSTHGTQRTIHEVRLHEVSAVTFPAYETTSFSARDAVNAARGVGPARRAAMATYADVDTCECGSTSEYGAYCSACGEPMATLKPSGDFCTSCGSALDGERDSHVCESRDDPDGKEYAAMYQAVLLIDSGDIEGARAALVACIPVVSDSADTEDSGAGSATPDEDERAEMALLAEQIRIEMEMS